VWRAPVRVLHLITRLIVGGAQENTLLTVAHLDRRRYEVTLASGPTVGSEGSLEGRIAQDVPFVRIPHLVRNPDPVRDLLALRQLTTLMRSGGYQIVHTHTTKAGMLGRLAACLARVPIVVHTPHGHAFHGYLNRPGSIGLQWIERLLALWTDRIVCLTEAEREDHLRLGIGPPSRFEVIHSGVHLERFGRPSVGDWETRRMLGLPAHGPLVGCVARLAPVKGVQHLLEAIPRITAAVPGSAVVFVGDGPLRPEMERRAQTLGLGAAAVFLGLRDDVPEIMAAFDVVALPSINEGMGRAAVEAMAAGKPVVGSRVSGIQNVIEHGVSGLLVPPADPGAIADAVVRVLQEPALRRTLTGNAMRTLHAYSVDAMMARIHRLYAQLVEAKIPSTEPVISFD
jgi:glycosyltransferase involved in cell wall biosynthesis